MVVYSKKQDGAIDAIICGEVSREPELKETRNGKQFIAFSVSFGENGVKDYIDCSVWADCKSGDVAGALERGDTVLAAGVYSTRQSGEKVYKKLWCRGVFVVGVPIAAAEEPANEPGPDDVSTSSFSELVDADGGELPF